MIVQTYNLNLIPDRVPVIVNCSQYDTLSRTIEMVIYDGSVLYTIPSGVSASVRGTKADNTGFEYRCEIDGSTVSFDIQDQMTLFAGKVPCEIRLISSTGIIGTCNFILNVEETTLDPQITISESDLPLLEEAEQNAIRSEAGAIRSEEAADRAERLVATAVKSVNGELPDANGNVDVDTLPTGGTTGQVLTKQSSADGDADWQDVDGLPSGGSAGQYLVKQSSTDGDATWQSIPNYVRTVNSVAPTNGNVDVEALPTGGTVGQVLTKNSSTDGDASWQTPSSGGGTTIYDGSTATTSYDELFFSTVASGVDTVKVGIDMDLLWTNSSPTSSFSAQTISLDMSGYTSILVYFYISTTINDLLPLLCLPNGSTYRACFTNGINNRNGDRDVTVSTSSLVFGSGTYNSANSGSHVIPQKVYGIR